jgi:hypothetical protein
MKTLLGLLRSHKTNLCCCAATVGLLAAGSVLMDLRRDLYEGLRADDLWYFFRPPRLAHWWLYALLPVVTLWGASSATVTLDALRSRLRRGGVLHALAHGPVWLHAAFPLALVAHLYSGVGGSSQTHPVLPDGAEIAGMRLRPLAIHEQRHPNGMPRQVTVTLERTRGALTDRVEIAYNRPLALDAGARLLLLGEYGQVPVATLRADGRTLQLVQGQPVRAGSRVLVLRRVVPAGQSLSVPVVVLAEAGPGGQREVWLPVGRELPGQALACLAVHDAPAVLLTERVNPGVPLVALVSLLAAVGVVLSTREHWRRRPA